MSLVLVMFVILVFATPSFARFIPDRSQLILRERLKLGETKWCTTCGSPDLIIVIGL